MAITGTGTQADPYIVHSYTELKTACNNNGVFVELANDIDCNSYGEDFEWDRVNVGTGTDFNLKGHTIKNFKVKENTYGFRLYDDTLVHNGKILNVYLSGSSGFATRGSNYGTFENISISINSSSGLSSNQMFDCVKINACAIYIEGKSADNGDACIFKTIGDNTRGILNSDILLNCPNNTSGSLLLSSSSGMEAFKNSRVRGVFNSTNENYNALIRNSNAKNCVFDLQTNINIFCGYNSNNTGVINTDKVPSGFSTNGMTAVTSQEIINGNALRAKGFDVINVTP